jgi:hypothetical protein
VNPPPPDLDDPDAAVRELRARLRAADTAFDRPPPGLALRVLRPPVTRPVWRGAFAVVLAAVMVVAVVGLGAFFAGRSGRGPATAPEPPAARAGEVEAPVYNTEIPCRTQRTIVCSLGVFKEPRLSSRMADLTGRVWHGDLVLLVCMRADGPLVNDETGVGSRHWYRVVVRETGVEGWLPAVRTRNEAEVPDCAS